MTQQEINTLAILRAFKLRTDVNGGEYTGLSTLHSLESRPDKPDNLPVSTTTWRDIKVILRQIDKFDREDDILGPFDPDAVWVEVDGQMVQA